MRNGSVLEREKHENEPNGTPNTLEITLFEEI